ncbi:MAG: hypothetical protein GAK45_01398 [Pseudomonas citronellolis]|nr:MAG: hypothetical protein GAK45_01398 [Pseudomonas citronellolis]
MLLQGALHVREHRPRVSFPAFAFGAQVAVGGGDLERIEQQRFVGFGEQRDIAHRHGCNRFTMVAIGQRDETFLRRLPAVEPVVVAHLQRHFDAGRAAVGIEHPVQARRGHAHQTLGQLDHWRMTEAGENHVLQLVELVFQALVDARIGMPEHVDPPGADGVQVAFALEILQPDALAPADRDHRQAFVVFHLGTGVPQHGEVALHPLCVEAHRHSPLAVAQAYVMPLR